MSSPYVPPAGLVDLHSHLVPGVDDGTATIAESLTALGGLAQQGVHTIVTTPHLLVPHLETDQEIGQALATHRRAFESLLAVRAAHPDLPALALGQEIWAPDAAAIRRVARRADVGLNGDYLLVEFGFNLLGTHTDVIQETLDSGRGIVIAHPERYTYPSGQDSLELMQCWRGLGALLQINVGSLTGHYERSSPGSEALAWRMVELDLVDLLATDHHGPRRAGVSPAEAWDALMARGMGALAQRAMIETPGAIIGGELPASRLPG
jgi:protein-tyrosine phosphatase